MGLRKFSLFESAGTDVIMSSSEKGIIFDIQKFVLDDGPGIRTVVFLKGCTLRCVWCCNPESYQIKPELGFFVSRCNNCGDCISVCPDNAINKGVSSVVINHDLCSVCEKCIDVCPTSALRIFGKTVSASEIIEEVIKDKDYFINSNGGITLSGGEALMQIDFAISILKLAKDNGLHTCIETAGNVPQHSISRILPYVDLFLFDYKLTDDTLHKKCTGANNQLILENFDFIYHSGTEMVMRCPIIPGINDTEEHFKGIVLMSQKYPAINGVELKPYHEYGKDKYFQVGYEPLDLGSGTVSKSHEQEWKNRLKSMGCKKLIE